MSVDLQQKAEFSRRGLVVAADKRLQDPGGIRRVHGRQLIILSANEPSEKRYAALLVDIIPALMIPIQNASPTTRGYRYIPQIPQISQRLIPIPVFG